GGEQRLGALQRVREEDGDAVAGPHPGIDEQLAACRDAIGERARGHDLARRVVDQRGFGAMCETTDQLGQGVHRRESSQAPPRGTTLPFRNGPTSVRWMVERLTPDRVREALRVVLYPGFQRDIVRLGMLGDVAVENGPVRVPLRPGTADPAVLRRLTEEITAVLRREPGVVKVEVQVAGAEAGARRDPWAARAALPGVA